MAGIAVTAGMAQAVIVNPQTITFVTGIGMPFTPVPLGQGNPGLVFVANTINNANGEREFWVEGVATTSTPTQFDVHIENYQQNINNALHVQCWQWSTSQWINVYFSNQPPNVWHTVVAPAIDPVTGLPYSGLVDPITFQVRLRVVSKLYAPPNVINQVTRYDSVYWNIN